MRRRLHCIEEPKHIGKCKKELKENLQSVSCMLKRSNQLWTGTDRGTIHIWNTTVSRNLLAQTRKQTLKPLKSLTDGHTENVHCLTNVGPFEIWSCSSDKTIRCWNADVSDPHKH